MTDKQKIRALERDNKRLRDVLAKITDCYVSAPGWAAPIPTPKLVWRMYQLALKAR